VVALWRTCPLLPLSCRKHGLCKWNVGIPFNEKLVKHRKDQRIFKLRGAALLSKRLPLLPVYRVVTRSTNNQTDGQNRKAIQSETKHRTTATAAAKAAAGRMQDGNTSGQATAKPMVNLSASERSLEITFCIHGTGDGRVGDPAPAGSIVYAVFASQPSESSRADARYSVAPPSRGMASAKSSRSFRVATPVQAAAS